MPRTPRIFIPGTSVHVIHRGNNRTSIFQRSSDYELFLEILRLASARRQVEIHAYVLMTNHFHLIATPASPDALPLTMKELGEKYVRRYNRQSGRTGTLWNGRYRSLLVDEERYLLTCLRYIEQNPVRARMVGDPGSYQWSSYPAHASGKWPAWLTPHPVYLALGRSECERQLAYQSLCGQLVEANDPVLRR